MQTYYDSLDDTIDDVKQESNEVCQTISRRGDGSRLLLVEADDNSGDVVSAVQLNST